MARPEMKAASISAWTYAKPSRRTWTRRRATRRSPPSCRPHCHLELAYKRGQEAVGSRAGYRVVQENERLRRELEQLRKGLT
ncbi:hypothetical protein ACQEVG_14370 [Streptomyces sp. CA-135486]|uniref:hypothetical protein n=1 Tax=Streptomyces sp. CA-135486 TaxID=3240049 RepID=UPI003D8BF704